MGRSPQVTTERRHACFPGGRRDPPTGGERERHRTECSRQHDLRKVFRQTARFHVRPHRSGTTSTERREYRENEVGRQEVGGGTARTRSMLCSGAKCNGSDDYFYSIRKANISWVKGPRALTPPGHVNFKGRRVVLDKTKQLLPFCLHGLE